MRKAPISLRTAPAYGLVVGVIAVVVFVAARRIDNQRATAIGGVTQLDYMTKIQPAGVSGSFFDRVLEGTRIQFLEVLRMVAPGALKTHVEVLRMVAPGALETHVKAGPWAKPNTWLSIVVSIPVIVGFLRLLVRYGDVMLWTTVFYLGLNVIWCGDQGGRYTLPILPVIAVALWKVAAEGRPRVARWLPVFVALHAAAGVGYWLAIELPRTREANAHWADIDALAAHIDHDRDGVALADVPKIDVNLWKLSLDRQVHDWGRDSGASREEVRWLVTGPDGEAPPGFEEVGARGAYRLWRRGE